MKKQTKRFLTAFSVAILPFAVATALAEESAKPEGAKHMTPAEASYEAGTSPLAGVEMHQDVNPKAPPMSEAEFNKGRQIYFHGSRSAGPC